MPDSIPTPKDVAENTGQAAAQDATGSDAQDATDTSAEATSTENAADAVENSEEASTEENSSESDDTSEEESAADKDGGADELKQWKTEARKHEKRAKENLTRAEKAEAEVARLTAASETNSLRTQVANDKGVPVDLLRGETKEELEEFADALLTFTSSSKPKTGPIVPEAGTGDSAGPINSEAEAALKQLGFG